jgi:hypothetical protein
MELIEAQDIDTTEIRRMAREWKLAVERGEDVEPIEKNITAWTIEAVYGGEAAWQWKKEKDDARKAAEKVAKDQAEIERKARILAEVKAFEDEHGPLDEAAKKMALANSQRRTSKAAK